MRFALRRLGFFVLTLWAAVTLNFFLPRMMPGNPALAMMAKFHGKLSAQALSALEVIFGVNSHQSLPAQYVLYLGQIATGNFAQCSPSIRRRAWMRCSRRARLTG